MPEPEVQMQDVASDNASAADNGSGSILGAIGEGIAGVLLSAYALGSSLWHAATSDGVLAAAGRQGADELGEALKAFPDSLQTQEVGTLFNPTQGEVAADRSDQGSGGLFHSSYYASFSHSVGPPETWPSEIAKNATTYDPAQDQGQDQSSGHSM